MHCIKVILLLYICRNFLRLWAESGRFIGVYCTTCEFHTVLNDKALWNSGSNACWVKGTGERQEEMHRKAKKAMLKLNLMMRWSGLIYCFDLLEHYIYFLCRFGCGDRHSKQNNTWDRSYHLHHQHHHHQHLHHQHHQHLHHQHHHLHYQHQHNEHDHQLWSNYHQDKQLKYWNERQR